MSDKPDLMNIIEAAMNTCHAEGDYDPENDYIKDPLCRRVYHALGQSAAEITRLRDAVRVLGAELTCIRRSWKGESEDGGLTWFNVDDSEVEEYGKLSDATDRNPIAAAAVRGEVKE